MAINPLLAVALLAAALAPAAGARAQEPPPAPVADSRAGDKDYEQSRRLLAAIDAILEEAARHRADARELPPRGSYVIPPLWSDTREDREAKARALLDAALEIVADAPVTRLQAQIRERRQAIAALRDRIAGLREKKLHAPEDGFMPGVFTQTRASIDEAITGLEASIRDNEAQIASLKAEIGNALRASGVEISAAQLDLLLDSVLGGDLLRLATAFEAARLIDKRLGELLQASGEDVRAARRYFAMHAALFAMLAHAQDLLIAQIDGVYLAKLAAILEDIKRTREETYKLLAGQNRPDQRRALEANLKAQDFAEKVASFYRDYLLTQRRQLLEARDRTLRDLRIADNTFETVQASFELRALMEDARASFEALQRLEAPGFDQIFQNETLRKEFETLTEKLAPSS